MHIKKVALIIVAIPLFVFSQTTNVGANSGTGGTNNSFYGTSSGENSVGDNNVFSGFDSGKNNTGNKGVFIGNNAGMVNTADDNTFIGTYSGMNNTTGFNNVFVGSRSGRLNTTGKWNTAVGLSSAANNTTGYGNTSLGYLSNSRNVSGYYNVSLGLQSGFYSTSGIYNTNVGTYAGTNNITGVNNTLIGAAAGYNSTGSNNVFLGFTAGREEQGSNKLYIENTNSSSPLIWGDFDTDVVNINGKLGVGTTTPQAGLEVKNDEGILIQASTNGGFKGSIKMIDIDNSVGTAERDDMFFGTSGGFQFKIDDNNNGTGEAIGFNVLNRTNESLFVINEKTGSIGIGTTIPDEKLTVKGKIHTQEVRVDLIGAVTPDYVFEKHFTGTSKLNPSYEMPTLEEVEAFTKANNHLPEIPSAREMEEKGIQLKEMNLKLLQKIEELTLYAIQQQKELEEQKDKNKSLEDRLEKIEKLLKR